MLNKHSNDVNVDRSKLLSFVHRHYLLLKCHYFLSYSSYASFGPILNITLRSRGLSNLEISYINLVIPFLIFFTNPLLGFFADHTRRFRLTFNVTFGLATILFIIMFFLPSIKTYNVHGELRQTETMDYSLTFCANKQFGSKCALRSQCGCIYQAICTPSAAKYHLNESSQAKTLYFNFTMDSTHVEKELKNVSTRSNKRMVCDIKYRISINETLTQYTENENTDSFGNIERSSTSGISKLFDCEIKCSIDHICDGSRYSDQIIYVLLYSFLIIICLNLFSNASTIGTSIGFETLDHSNLFGRQRVWGTIGFGITAFVSSRLYAHFKTDYVYIIMFIVTSILTILVTSFIRFQSDRSKEPKSQDDDLSVLQNLNDSSINENTKTKRKNRLFNISALVPLLKKVDVIVFLSTTFIWGMSFGALDPYLNLYIDEINPCQSHSIIGYMSLTTASVEIVAFIVSHKFLKRFGIKLSTMIIFLAFVIRFFGYYSVNRLYFILFFETMHFFNFGILFVLISQEAFAIAPPKLAGTLQGAVNGISFGLGRGVGLLISLFIYTRMKKRYLFLIYAIFNLVGIIVYLIYCLLSKRRSLSLTASNEKKDDVSKTAVTKFETSRNEEPLLSST